MNLVTNYQIKYQLIDCWFSNWLPYQFSFWLIISWLSIQVPITNLVTDYQSCDNWSVHQLDYQFLVNKLNTNSLITDLLTYYSFSYQLLNQIPIDWLTMNWLLIQALINQLPVWILLTKLDINYSVKHLPTD